MATTLKAMRRQELHPAQRGNLASGPAIAAPDREEHVQLVEADQRFQAALEHAIATGSERIEAVEATPRFPSKASTSWAPASDTIAPSPLR
jgi:hypothetical protein